MAMHIVSDLPLLGQDKTNGCWYFSAKMMAGWASKSGKAIKDPSTFTDLFSLYDGNCGYALSTCGTLGKKLGMTALPRQDRSASDMMTLLSKGPLWAAGLKNSGGETFPHVVVLGGVADTGVLVLDPLPLNQGGKDWKTWSWLKSFLALDDSSFDANLLAPA